MPPLVNRQRIYNALRALVYAGPFYECDIDPKTGQMSIDTANPLSLDKISFAASEINSTFRTAKQYRQHLCSERETWMWIVRIGFAGVTVSFEDWEESLLVGDIPIPTTRLFARLVAADYNPPPQASPNNGSAAEFAFQITSESLMRK